MGKSRSERRFSAKQKKDQIQILQDSLELDHPFRVFNPDEIKIILSYKSSFEAFEWHFERLCRTLHSFSVASNVARIMNFDDPDWTNDEHAFLLLGLKRLYDSSDDLFTILIFKETFTNDQVEEVRLDRRMVRLYRENVDGFTAIWDSESKKHVWQGIAYWKAKMTQDFWDERNRQNAREVPEVWSYFTFISTEMCADTPEMPFEPHYFSERLVDGCRNFFGVRTDRCGNVYTDENDPDRLERYRDTQEE